MGQTAIPPGDRGEQLIANLTLSSIAYQFDARHAREFTLLRHVPSRWR
jgi:hypothetical protein